MEKDNYYIFLGRNLIVNGLLILLLFKNIISENKLSRFIIKKKEISDFIDKILEIKLN